MSFGRAYCLKTRPLLRLPGHIERDLISIVLWRVNVKRSSFPCPGESSIQEVWSCPSTARLLPASFWELVAEVPANALVNKRKGNIGTPVWFKWRYSVMEEHPAYIQIEADTPPIFHPISLLTGFQPVTARMLRWLGRAMAHPFYASPLAFEKGDRIRSVKWCVFVAGKGNVDCAVLNSHQGLLNVIELKHGRSVSCDVCSMRSIPLKMF